MENKTAEFDLFVQQINHLKRSVCPERYQYTLEYLDLAMTAARREAPCAIFSTDDENADDRENERDTETCGVADPIIVH